MSRQFTLMASALVVSLGVADLAAAHGKGDGPRRGAMFEQMFEEADSNADGKVTPAELQALRAARFAAADTDGDGKLSLEEMQARQDTRRVKRLERMIDRLDADGDGLLSAEEMAEGTPRRDPMEMFQRLDTDEDGALTLDEMRAARGGHMHGGKRWRWSDDG